LGNPLIPGRAAARSQTARSHTTRSTIDPVNTVSSSAPWIVVVAALTIASLVAATATGAISLVAAAPIALLVPAAVVDIEQRRLPDAWVGGALVALVSAVSVESAIRDPTDITHIVGGGLALALPVLILHLASPASMGFGDVKVAAVLGAAIGTVDWRLAAVALCVAALSGAIVGLAARARSIPFGPFLVFGAWLVLLAQHPILNTVFAGGVAQ
jgi:leader peptidase (prepilin peptidase)/N-methyltransferase